MSVTYSGDSVLDIMSECAVNKNNIIENYIIKYFDLNNLNSKKKILEFGTGKGEFLNRFINNENLETYGIEIDDSYLKILSKNHKVYKSIEDININFDFIYSIDVIEHIKDDSKIIKDIYNKLSNNGLLLIYVPARMELFSKFDEQIGHYRRYNLKEIVEKVQSAGFKVEVSRYDDFLGYFASLYNKYTTNGSLNKKAVKLYDKFFVPLSFLIDKIINPIGKNILLVAKKEKS